MLETQFGIETFHLGELVIQPSPPIVSSFLSMKKREWLSNRVKVTVIKTQYIWGEHRKFILSVEHSLQEHREDLHEWTTVQHVLKDDMSLWWLWSGEDERTWRAVCEWMILVHVQNLCHANLLSLSSSQSLFGGGKKTESKQEQPAISFPLSLLRGLQPFIAERK